MTNSKQSKSTRYAILGFPRSGTTLLSRLLDSHPDISCPPETHLLTAAARFLTEQKNVEGPPIGVLSGLNFLGIDADAVMSPLRRMVFDFHEQIAGGAAIWVEKTGVDIFHLETLEPLLVDHVRFILINRHPLDVIASNVELAQVMGAPLSDLWQMTRNSDCPYEGLARAWSDRSRALIDFSKRNEDDCFSMSYEDLTSDPQATLGRLMEFMGLEQEAATTILESVFNHQPQIGLGDFRTNEMNEIRPPSPNGWRKRLPRTVVSRMLPHMAAEMESLGYSVPNSPPTPTREDAVRQFLMATEMKRQAAARQNDE